MSVKNRHSLGMLISTFLANEEEEIIVIKKIKDKRGGYYDNGVTVEVRGRYNKNRKHGNRRKLLREFVMSIIEQHLPILPLQSRIPQAFGSGLKKWSNIRDFNSNSYEIRREKEIYDTMRELGITNPVKYSGYPDEKRK